MSGRHLALVLSFSGFVPPAVAQHDVQRNAVRKIALGQFAEAERELGGKRKPNAGEAETLFVEMLSALGQGKVEAAGTAARRALDAGLPPGRLVAGPRALLGKLDPIPATRAVTLVHGPMVGAVTDTAASFWVRTARPAKVTVAVGDRRASGRTTADRDFTTVVRVEGLTPGSPHRYEVHVDGLPVEVENAVFRTFPPAGKPAPFTVAFGGGAGFIPEWERMWDTIARRKPHAMLMLGDNVYIDQPGHALTQHYCYYRRQSRPEWRRLAAGTPVFSIWDDHDFGTNDCVPGPDVGEPAWKREVWEIFRQNWVNPAYGGGTKQPGCWYDFTIADVHFIMLDGRYYRDLEGGSMLGPVQKAWLKKTLESSTGAFKVIASPVPFSPRIKPGSRDPWDGFPDERAEIFSWIRDGGIGGVFLIAADRHRTDLRTIPNPGAYTLYEFESSRLTNRHTHPVVKTDGLVWGYNKACSFGLMAFDTSREDPEVRFDCIDIDGTVHHTHTLKRSALEAPLE